MAKASTDKKKIKELLERGVEKIVVKKHLESRLLRGERLRVKHGIDPTGPNIHIGRATQLWKLKAFQELGHQVVLIIGDYTAQIGDASDKQAMRKCLTKKEIAQNMKDYEKQIGKILETDKAELRYNSEWLSKLTARDILLLSMHFTAQQLIQRRNFKERWDKGQPIGLHELDYPLLQGYDSVAIKADVELGGFDQLFNLLAGREIQRIARQQPQDIMTLKMLFGLDGRKMATSWGNVINISDEPNKMFGKIMSMKDELMVSYFELCTQLPLKDVAAIKTSLAKRQVNPRDVKAKLAKEVVTLYHGSRAAQKAEEEFERVFKKKAPPSQIPVFKTTLKQSPIMDLLKQSGLAPSKSEAKRLILSGAVKINGKTKNKWQETIGIKEGMVIKVGKRKFIKIKKG